MPSNRTDGKQTRNGGPSSERRDLMSAPNMFFLKDLQPTPTDLAQRPTRC